MLFRSAYEGNAGLGFALSIDLIEKVLPRLRQGVEFIQGYLGIATEESETGLRIVNVSAKNDADKPTAAAAAGLKVGDILVEINGQAVARKGDLQRALAHVMAGDEITLVWLRGEQQMTVKTKLGVR